MRALFAAHPEWRIIHGHYSGFGMFYNPAARAGIPVRCGHSHNTAYERNFVGRLDHFMSSFFNIGLTDRFACSEKAGQMLLASIRSPSCPTASTRRGLPPATRSAVRFAR
ncbi:hypothetical protein NIA69_08050 [Gemmiger formicilis]|nr:hypothetical protein [Gemmiger formicilis]